jgi:hypothetical protein
MATPVDLSDRESLLRAASTSLNSKVSKKKNNIMNSLKKGMGYIYIYNSSVFYFILL